MTGRRLKNMVVYSLLTVLMAINGAWASQSISNDYLTFRSHEHGKTYLEYQFILSNRQLNFVKTAAAYHAGITATLHLYSENGSLQAKHTIKKDIESATFTETKDATVAHAFSFNFNVNPGHYRSILVLEDAHSQKGKTFEKLIFCEDYYSGPAISSIELSAANREQNAEYFSRVFTHENPSVGIYYESYNVPVNENAKSHIPTTYRVIDSKGKVWLCAEESLSVSQSYPAFKLDFSVAHLPSEQYRFVVEQNISGKTARSEAHFRVIQSPVEIPYKKFSRRGDELYYKNAGKDYTI